MLSPRHIHFVLQREEGGGINSNSAELLFYSIGLPFHSSSLSSVDRHLVHSCIFSTLVKIVEYTVSSVVVKPLYIHSHSLEAVPFSA